eukprot:403336934
MQQSQIQNCMSKDMGGVIFSKNSNITSRNCNFTDNQALFAENIFSANTGYAKGGVIQYNKQRPILQNNKFKNNYAPYGSDIAGYPYSVKILSYDQIEIASGIIKISEYKEHTKVSGKYQVQVSDGIGILKDLVFSAKPGSKNVPFEISSSSINTQELKKIFNTTDNINMELIHFDFRECILGEINVSNECAKCGLGYYSLDQSQKQCLECPSNAECPGGSEIIVKQGYWRSSENSTNIIKCLNEDACQGGQIQVSPTTNSSIYIYPLCQYGYGGNLCDSCVEIDGKKFTRTSPHQCGLCPSRETNFIYIIGVFLGLIFAFSILLWINLRSEKESETSIILRIILNYFQILTSAAAYQLNWPSYLEQFFGIYTQVGQAAEAFISFDCFLTDTGFTQGGSSIYYFKTIIISNLPIIFGLIFIAIFAVGKVIFKYTKEQMQRKIIVSCILIMYSIHPTITRMISSLYFCMELDDGEYWLQTDLQVKCWEGQHLTWSLGIGLPTTIIWILGLPLFGLFFFFHCYCACEFLIRFTLCLLPHLQNKMENNSENKHDTQQIGTFF